MKRIFQATLALSAVLAAFACSGGTNNPSTDGGDGDGDGDDNNPTGGATGDGDGTGGVTGDGDGDGGGTRGGDGDGDTSGSLGDPICGLTKGGLEIKKGEVCTAEDTQLCYRTCGPESSGFKTETCSGGAYVEGDCAFPAEGDYSCFAIPTTQAAECPTDVADTPTASALCDVPTCSPCNVNGQYFDSKGAPKAGYCVCQEANSSGERKWSCGSSTAWPCPLGNGC